MGALNRNEPACTVPDMNIPKNTSAPDVGLTVEITEGVVVLRTTGEVDVVTAPLLEDKLRELGTMCGNSVLIADLSDVRFLSSAGLAVLMRIADSLGDRSRFLVVATGPNTYRPMELTGLTEELEVFESVEAALSTV